MTVKTELKIFSKLSVKAKVLVSTQLFKMPIGSKSGP